jgi:hypothetical protein
MANLIAVVSDRCQIMLVIAKRSTCREMTCSFPAIAEHALSSGFSPLLLPLPDRNGMTCTAGTGFLWSGLVSLVFLVEPRMFIAVSIFVTCALFQLVLRSCTSQFPQISTVMSFHL